MKIETIRHSLAHVLAYAVSELYPGAKLGMGPAIENGFYYDFDLKAPLSPQDLSEIEKKMRESLGQHIAFKKKAITQDKAKKLFKGQPYKLELLKQLKQPTVYESGKFVDLCAGPHVKTTNNLPADVFKLTKIAGAYWKGNEKNKMLTRVYGVAFASKNELNDYLKIQEEAEKRDHRIIGQKLELFTFNDEVGQGLPLWMPKGALLRKIIMDFAIDT